MVTDSIVEYRGTLVQGHASIWYDELSETTKTSTDAFTTQLTSRFKENVGVYVIRSLPKKFHFHSMHVLGYSNVLLSLSNS